MRSGYAFLAGSLLFFIACAGKAPPKNDLALSGDPKADKNPSAPAEGDDSQGPATPSGDPQPAPDESANPAPRPDGGARTKDAGSSDPQDPQDPPPDPQDPPPNDPPADPPYDPALDPNSCWSATLKLYEEPGACVQSATTQLWYQCHATQWFQGVNGANGPYGKCTSLHPL